MSTRRPGITLVEVLVAIFIMGIGMLAVLVLFPLGALNMARALKDDRCGTIAANADALAAAFNLRKDPTVLGLFQSQQNGLSPDPNGQSYPVFVDPYYVLNSGGTLGTVGNPSAIARMQPYYVNSTTDASNWFSLNDDLYFDINGLPTSFFPEPPNFLPGPLQRQGYYTYAYMLRRVEGQQANSVQLWVIVYSGRPIQTPTMEPTYSASFNPNSTTSVTLSWAAGQVAPDLRRGSWLLDNSFSNDSQGFGYVNGKFYKVMEAINSGGNSMSLEVYPPIQDTSISQMVVLTNAVEVFDRGTGR